MKKLNPELLKKVESYLQDSMYFHVIVKKACEEKINELKNCPRFKAYSWRRKVKILNKESTKFLTKYHLNVGFFFLYNHKMKIKDIETIEKYKKEIQNAFLSVINFYTYNVDPYHFILKSDITNADGAYLTRLARKKRTVVTTEFLRHFKESNFPFRRTPFGYFKNEYIFWNGMKYILDMKKL
jgi:hypothetical protein